MVIFELLIDGNAPESAKRRGELDAGIPRATSSCGHEGGIAPSTSVMFGTPNIDDGLRAVDRRQRSGASKRRGELDAGIPKAKSLCGYEGRIDWRQTLFTATALQ